MSDIVNQITRATTAKIEDLRALRTNLEQNFDLLRARSQHVLTDVARHLAEIDPGKYTLGITYVLAAKAHVPKLDIQNFVVRVEHLLTNFVPEQAHVCAKRFAGLVHAYVMVLADRKKYYRAIRFVHGAVNKFMLPNTLTPLHADFLLLCLKAKLYKFGAEFCEDKIFDVNPDKSGMRAVDMLLYCYYGGMIHIGMKKYRKALEMLDFGLTVPAQAFDAIMIEMFKKKVLVELLTDGKFLGIAKSASQIVHRHMKVYCDHYVDFANAYASNDFAKVEGVYREHQAEFRKDRNEGLIKQCLDAFNRRNILNLTKTFVTISLADIAKECRIDSPKLVERYLLQMIDKGEVDAVINQEDGRVSFRVREENFDESTVKILMDRIGKAQELTERLQKMDREIAKSLTYVARRNGIRDPDSMDFGGGGRRSALGSVLRGMERLFFHQ